jgi:GT2 family glycosyltransferase
VVSVIVVAYRANDTIHECLRSLLAQTSSAPFEVIVVESSADGTAEALRGAYPKVQVLKSDRRRYPGEGRNIGIGVARGQILAFLDADCTVERDWISTVARAHAGSDRLVVGGIIDNGARDRLVSWAYYFCEFNLWLPSARPRLIPEIAGCCLSMKRSAFDRYGPFLTGTYCADTAFLRDMHRDGHLVQFIPAVRVYHRVVSCGLGHFLAHIFHHRKAYAQVTARQLRFSRPKRALWAASEVLLPPLLLLLIASRVARSGYSWKWFLAASPLVLTGIVARCAGELMGYLHLQR